MLPQCFSCWFVSWGGKGQKDVVMQPHRRSGSEHVLGIKTGGFVVHITVAGHPQATLGRDPLDFTLLLPGLRPCWAPWRDSTSGKSKARSIGWAVGAWLELRLSPEGAMGRTPTSKCCPAPLL